MRPTLIYKFIEFLPFLVLWFDALKHQVRGVSAQTCAALTLSILLASFNQPKDEFDAFAINTLTFVIGGVGLACTVVVAMATDVGSEDDLLPRWSMPRWAQWTVIYILALILTLVASFAACHFSPAEWQRWVTVFPVGILCTYQNFLHGTALLPQLLICRQRGFVAPAAARFLMITAIKHVIEFVADAIVSFHLWQAQKLNLHEASYMSADLFAAVMLLDFMYLVFVSYNCCSRPRLGAACLRRSGSEKAERMSQFFAASSLPLQEI